jgi:hypothetical protein
MALNDRVPVMVTNLPANVPPAQALPQVTAAPQFQLAIPPVGHQQLFAFAAMPLAVVVPLVTALVAPSFTVTVAPAQAAPFVLATMPLSVASSSHFTRPGGFRGCCHGERLILSLA